MKRNNLFMYATSELSQDAFICWLLEFASEEHLNEDIALTSCAKELLSNIITTGENLIVTSVLRQYKKIDVLVKVNDKYNIIIEDKTFTGQHGDQINEYKKTLEDEGRKDIICVYYKIVEQAYPEKTHININRVDLIKIFSKYIDKTHNNIFNDYYEYLIELDEDVKSYKNEPIEVWRKDYNHAYKGFFTHIVNENTIEIGRNYDWGYVSNKSSGFWGLWWFYIKGKELEMVNLNETYLNELYLQIEDNIIAVKMTGEGEMITNIRWNLYRYFDSKISGFKKKTFRQGKWMTIGYMEYNEKNYKEKIEQMQAIMQSIVDGEYN